MSTRSGGEVLLSASMVGNFGWLQDEENHYRWEGEYKLSEEVRRRFLR